MQLIKTLRAKDALQDRDSALSTRQRQILILSDGKRTSAQLLDLMGPDAQADIDVLMRLRYLVRDDEVQLAESGFAPTAAGEMWDVSEFNDGIDLPSDFTQL
jgi:hypothetical protein